MSGTIGGRVPGSRAAPRAAFRSSVAGAGMPFIAFTETFDQPDSTDLGPVLDWSEYGETPGLSVGGDSFSQPLVPSTVANVCRGVTSTSSSGDPDAIPNDGTFAEDAHWIGWTKTQLTKRGTSFLIVAADAVTDDSSVDHQEVGIGFAYPETAEFFGGIATGNPPTFSANRYLSVCYAAFIVRRLPGPDGWSAFLYLNGAYRAPGDGFVAIDEFESGHLELRFVDTRLSAYIDGEAIYDEDISADFDGATTLNNLRDGVHYGAVLGGGRPAAPGGGFGPYDMSGCLLTSVDNFATLGIAY